MNDPYDSANDIKRLTDVEHARLRPQLYVGDVTTPEALHRLAFELIHNSMDEVKAGVANNIHVTIHFDGSLTVEDDGRGISVDRCPSESECEGREITWLEIAMTRLMIGKRK
jgi:DNA gyrase subunit B